MDFGAYHDRAERRYGLSREETALTYIVLNWFNGRTFGVGDRVISIGSAYEPELRQLVTSQDLPWTEGCEEAHDHLRQRGILIDGYLAGRRCDWIPTQDFFTVVENVFHDADGCYPTWVTEAHTGPPAYRDGGTELMLHRKGALALSKSLEHTEYITGTELFPRIGIAEAPDIRAWTRDDTECWGEIIGDHNNRETWTRKFRAWEGNDIAVMWIFANRKNMVQFWNHLIRHGVIDLDNGMFGSPANNWSAQRVNDRLQRSRNKRVNYGSHDACWTVGGLIEGGLSESVSWILDYDIV